MDIASLSKEWLELKEAEKIATESRRKIEDQLLSLIGIPETLDGTENVNHDAYTLKIVGRMNRKVDTDKLQELAAANGLTEHLSSLFRWKAEINTAIWKASADNLTRPLLDAITTSPGRPSFSIIVKE